MKSKENIIFLVGPTASGKTAIALELAKKINGEIISCDSMQIYKELNITSDKPDKSLRNKIKHHLIDVVSVGKNYNVSDYRKQAKEAIEKIHNKGRIPIVAGGSGLYMRVLLDGIFQEGKADNKIRNKLYKQAKDRGSKYLFRRLKKVDPQACKKIHPNDLRRIVRALEVYEKTKTPISKLQKQTKDLFQDYSIKLFGLEIDRDKLYERIEKRVDGMFEDGLVKEVKGVLRKKISQTAKGLIGIKEIKGFVKGEYSESEAAQLLKRNTRRYAKRQLTWFRKEKRIKWLPIKDNDKPIKVAKRIICLLN